ncbi:YhzD family protein [Halalkalibacterium halodurans]|uniref:YhzD family protein n=1 Tax=Halalkalibacterium halodurans TaxID=86665 RepID=UPI002AA9EB94|nr:YhzD family protein [Halalkalibacterium halodurans]MDY7221689.1 YhzD family protein [Halalkalibacterium halodurans]MDY7240965.1 YhzD family protein [Halalkalibacterium halodurans]MED4079363.1 YhzD family protein [Halalkalibacterium halodurans]MED4085434.1 YhzD family protein [Halalkalibacterium halodurans]MED4104442.1 YhzD family protein [Halalkalibacterium halodurans]
MNYFLTVYDPTGEKLLDEQLEASSDAEAKELGKLKLKEHGYEEHTHRMIRSGKLLLFHR